jgi:hypothetical protein
MLKKKGKNYNLIEICAIIPSLKAIGLRTETLGYIPWGKMSQKPSFDSNGQASSIISV